MQYELFPTNKIEYEETDYKECHKCGETKLKTEFWSDAARVKGKTPLQKRCKVCKYRAEAIVYHLKKKHVKDRSDTCDCCGIDSKFVLHCDHDYETSELRGWLCRSCNIGIGVLGDNISGLEKALAYLIKHRDKQ